MKIMVIWENLNEIVLIFILEDVCSSVTYASLHVYDVEAAKVFVWYER